MKNPGGAKALPHLKAKKKRKNIKKHQKKPPQRAEIKPPKALSVNRRTVPSTPADVYLRGRRGHDGATGVAKRTPAAHSRYMAAGDIAGTLPQRTKPKPATLPYLFFF